LIIIPDHRSNASLTEPQGDPVRRVKQRAKYDPEHFRPGWKRASPGQDESAFIEVKARQCLSRHLPVLMGM
jgi:hypothetical protein